MPSRATFKELDVCAPEAAALVREGNFDVICHLAAQIDVRKSVADPAADATLNIGGSLNLLEAVRQSKHATRFVFSSTGGAVYGDLVEPPTPEEASKDPQSPYGTAKFSVELYMGYFARVHGLDCVALRYSNVYGPRQDPHGEAGVVAIFCDRLIDGTPLTIFGDGGQTRDYVFVGDVARANLAACDDEAAAGRRRRQPRVQHRHDGGDGCRRAREHPERGVGWLVRDRARACACGRAAPLGRAERQGREGARMEATDDYS